jgi:hypothetical protein
MADGDARRGDAGSAAPSEGRNHDAGRDRADERRQRSTNGDSGAALDWASVAPSTDHATTGRPGRRLRLVRMESASIGPVVAAQHGVAALGRADSPPGLRVPTIGRGRIAVVARKRTHRRLPCSSAGMAHPLVNFEEWRQRSVERGLNPVERQSRSRTYVSGLPQRQLCNRGGWVSRRPARPQSPLPCRPRRCLVPAAPGSCPRDWTETRSRRTPTRRTQLTPPGAPVRACARGAQPLCVDRVPVCA